MATDYDAAYKLYLDRFRARFGEKPEGSFVRMGKHMVQKLSAADLRARLDHYVVMHAACKRMLESGSTISDATVLEFDEAAAWIAIQAPNLLEMFSGELGDPDAAAPKR